MKRRPTLLLLAFLLVTLLTGCGGGGSGSGSTGASSASSDTSSSTTVPNPTPTPAPTPPTGAGSLAGNVTDEQGNAVSGASVQANVQAGAKTASDSTPVSATTDANGAFTLRGLAIGQPYVVSIAHEGRVTLLITVTLDAQVPSPRVTVVAPLGSGTVAFTLPSPIAMNPPVTNGDQVALSWQASTDPGFVGYVVYRSTSSDVAPSDSTQIALKLAAEDTSFTDTLPSPGQAFYYRVYEKVLVPSANLFILIGSNVTQTVFPSVTNTTPTGHQVAASTPLQITFSVPMNQASVEAGLAIQSDVYGEPAVQGQTSWSANTLTFTPDAWNSGRVYTVTLSGATDARGDALPTYSTSFGIVSGYTLDTSLDATALGALRLSQEGALAVDGSGNVGVADNTNHVLTVYSMSGAQLRSGSINLNVSPMAADGSGRFYALSFPPLLDIYDSALNPVANFSPGMGVSIFARDNTRGDIYFVNGLTSDAQRYDASFNLLAQATLPTHNGAMIVGCTVDAQGRLITARGSYGPGSSNLQVFGPDLLETSNIVLDQALTGVAGLSSDASGNIYLLWEPQGVLEFRKYDASLQLLTKVTLGGASFSDSISVDLHTGAVYVLYPPVANQYQVQRYLPTP
jgi:hypothetical protein